MELVTDRQPRNGGRDGVQDRGGGGRGGGGGGGAGAQEPGQISGSQQPQVGVRRGGGEAQRIQDGARCGHRLGQRHAVVQGGRPAKKNGCR